ncbi:hemicentin-1-like [Mercenaria mercenaria]|uniref:hemicentin-1-like n=1 Tax=Mercenaria mercenaria TaxID=6596 RepID=UPI00234EFBE1|nr:hemicentin-1-like [Mercenaria mercenaria]
MIFRAFIVFLLVAPRNVASLSCYNCTDIDSLDSCQTVIDCEKEESCFTRSQTTGRHLTYTMGCTDNEKCGSIPVYDTMSMEMSNEKCYECCGSEKCNNRLCKHKTPPPCEDTDENCSYWNQKFDICKDIHDAKMICRKFCKLCSLVDGNWASWSSWSSCDVTCGHGIHTRIRTCTNPAPAYRGLDCNGNNTDTKPCVRPLCPVHGCWSEWSNWGTCPVTCGTGIQKRHRTCTNPSPLRYGDHCFGDATDVQLCMQGSCKATDGKWTNWGGWDSCSASCNGGIRKRSRSCTNPSPDEHGKYCDGDPFHVEMCNKQSCKTSNSSVAFNAYYVTDTAPAAGKTMVFSKVLVNQGGYYNCSSGIFVAPRNGTYIFNAKMCVQNRHSAYFNIMVDGVSYASAYAYDQDSGDCPFTQAVAELETNQQVFVKWGSWSRILYQTSPYYENMFSGYLVHE